MKSGEYCVFCISTIKSAKRFTKTLSSYHNNGRKHNSGKRSQKNLFSVHQPKDESLKHETEFIIKSNKSLAENKTKNEIEQLLLK